MRIAFTLLAFAIASVPASAAPVSLDRAALERLGHLPVGGSFVVDALPDGAGTASKIRFERVDFRAPGARVVVVDGSGEHELPKSTRIELIGKSESGDVRIALAFDPATRSVSGVGASPRGAFVVRGEPGVNGAVLHSVPLESTYPAGVVPRIIGSDDGLPSGRPMPSDLELKLSPTTPAGGVVSAVVAVDTDNELMIERFGNDTTAAANWVADLFTVMNVMYQRDLGVTLLQGETKLRTATDPYTQTGSPADGNDLDEFGSYWQQHYGNVDRDFAMLLSGKSTSGNSASGIAWINAYCETQSQGGSYSVNQVFTNPQVSVDLSARIVGHELGHNFGAWHTHCTNVANGGAPTGSNTIDQCYNGESGAGCYSGPTSCPSSGPGAPAGTIMSYCNIAGCGSDHQNVLVFHPTQVSTLTTLIAQHTPSCLAPFSDLIFKGTFDP
jgi:hypothetical protein